MKTTIIAIIAYFPLVLIYKVFGNPLNNYWINAYWFAVSIDSIFLFIGIRKVCKDLVLLNWQTVKIYRNIAFAAACYWGVMAAIRLYLFFNISKHYDVILCAGKITTGSVCIAIIFIYLTAKIWLQK